MLGIQVAPAKPSWPRSSTSRAVVAARKAAEAYAQLGEPVLVDDTGLTVHAWNGLPGALVAWFLDTAAPRASWPWPQDSPTASATVSTALGYATANGVRVFQGPSAAPSPPNRAARPVSATTPSSSPNRHQPARLRADDQRGKEQDLPPQAPVEECAMPSDWPDPRAPAITSPGSGHLARRRAARLAAPAWQARGHAPAVVPGPTFDVPVTDLPCTWPATPTAMPAQQQASIGHPSPARYKPAQAGTSSLAIVSVRSARTRSPSALRAAAIPTASRVPRRAEAPGRLPHRGRRTRFRHPGAAAIGDLDPDDAVPGPDRDRDRLARSARAAVPDAVTEQLAHQQDRDIPARVPGAEHPPTNARATRARSARPASVTLSRTASPAISTPAFPAAPPREITRAAGRTHGDARSTRPRTSSRNTPGTGSRGRP